MEETKTPNFDRIEKKSWGYMLLHFDRLHDKLFNFTNVLIVGYFTLSQLQEFNIRLGFIFVPLFNLVVLIYIEYYWMNTNRLETAVKEIVNPDRKMGLRYNKLTLISLFSIFLTFIVTVIFLYFLFA